MTFHLVILCRSVFFPTHNEWIYLMDRSLILNRHSWFTDRILVILRLLLQGFFLMLFFLCKSLTVIGWIIIKCGADIHAALRMNPTIPDITVCRFVCDLHILRTVHFISFTFGMWISKGPRTSSVQIGAIWTSDLFIINRHWLNRWPVLCSSSGWDSSWQPTWQRQPILQFELHPTLN